MATDATESGKISADQIRWGLHPDQSFLGRPIDPEVVARVRSSLDKYQGPRCLEDHERIVAAKVGAAKSWDRAATAEYWAWMHRVKDRLEPGFTLPDDPKKGMPSQEEYIKANVDRGLKEMREQSKEYKAWIESMKAAKEREKREVVEAKAEADAQFNAAAGAAEEARKKRDAEIRSAVRQTEDKYWKWHSDMKARVAQRPSSAPAARDSGVECAASMAARKKAEWSRTYREIGQEYSVWVQNVSKPKFSLPLAKEDREGRIRREAVAKSRVRKAHKEEKKYFSDLDEVYSKHHERIMGHVKDRLEADKKYNEDQEQMHACLAIKTEREKKRQQAVVRESRKVLKDIEKRVKEKPLFLEMAYAAQ